MADFDLTQIDTDLASICSVSYAGEAFLYSGGATTLYGVFDAQQTSELTFELDGRHDDRTIALHFNRTAVTPVEDVTIYRFFDATTYRIINADQDIQGWTCQLKKPY